MDDDYNYEFATYSTSSSIPNTSLWTSTLDQDNDGRAKALIPTKRKLLSFNMSSASNKRTKTEVNRASNKAFDLLTKEEK
ncbi:409_t:CDS:2, partial [Cetraspora pellucida]